jgi:hypothetical protein
MNKFIILLRPSPYMLNNLFITVWFYIYLEDLVNLRPKIFPISCFRNFVVS